MFKNKAITLFIFLIINALIFGQQIGKASFYSNRLKAHHTSDGGKYNPDSLTCAHRTYPFGTILKVRNPKNGYQVIVKVTDRGPRQRKLLIDLSYSAAKQLDILRYGIAQVVITRLDSMPINRMILEPISIPISKVGLAESAKTNKLSPNDKIQGLFF